MTTTDTGFAPKPHALHKEALAALFKQRRLARALVSLPAGSDTTLLGRWHAEQTTPQLVVVSVPSSDLVAPTLFAYQAGNSPWTHTTMVVCAGASPRRPLTIDELGLPDDLTTNVTSGTSERSILNFLAAPTQAARLIITTHDHTRDVAVALVQAHRKADLLVCDHAETLTGQPRARFNALLDSSGLPAQHRLFLATTPTEATAWLADADANAKAPLSLGDVDTFGQRVYTATHKKAIHHNVIVPTEVFLVTDDADHRQHTTSPGIAQTIFTAAQNGAATIITLHSRDDDAERLARAIDGTDLPHDRTIRSHVLTSDSPSAQRAAMNDALSNPDPHAVTVVAVGPTLAAGVDFPGADAVIFADSRVAPATIVTAIGAAAKPAPGRNVCRIILPVTLATALHDVDSALVTSPWREPWLVLRALAQRSLGDAAHLIRATAYARAHATTGSPPAGPKLQLRVGDATDRSWALQPVAEAAPPRQALIKALRRWAGQNGHAHPTHRATYGKYPVGAWLRRLRHLYADDLLLPTQIAVFESMPTFAWTPEEAAWWDAERNWRKLLANRRQLPDDAALWTALAATPGYNAIRTDDSYETLAHFASDTCARRRAGNLPLRLARAAEALPGWRFDYIADDDHDMLGALRIYVHSHSDFNAPHDYVHRTLPLGAWLTALRRRNVDGRLTPALRYEIAQLHTRFPDATPFYWDREATLWRLSFIARVRHATRTGNLHVPAGHIEKLPHFEVDLSHWDAVQQASHRAGTLDQERVTAMHRFTNWVWHATPTPDEEHRLAASLTPRSCPCATCIELTSPPGKPVVDAAPASRHVRIMRSRGSSPAVLAALAGLPLTTITELEAGTITHVPPAMLEAVLTIPIHLAPNPDECGSRSSVPAGPIWDAVARIRANGWSQTWLERQVGTTLHRERDTMNATVAGIVLHVCAVLADRQAPKGVPADALPNLATILAEERQAS